MLKESIAKVCTKLCQIISELQNSNDLPSRIITQVEEEGFFRRFKHVNTPNCRQVVFSIIDKVPEYNDLLKCIENDPLLRKFFFGWEQVGNFGSRLNPTQLILFLLEEMDWDPCQFETIFPQFEEALKARKVTMEQRAYLSNLDLDLDLDQFKFSNGVILKKMNLHDANRILAGDWLPPEMDLKDHRCYLSVEHIFAREIFENPDEREESMVSVPDSREIFREMVNFFRVFHNTNVLVRALLLDTKGFSVFKQRIASSGFWNDVPNIRAKLTKEDLVKIDNQIVNIRSLELPKKKKARLTNAIEWFGGRIFRHREQDKLLDIVVALETLFVSDDKELSYQFALRTACLLGETAEERKEIFLLMRTAYNLRSKMVHSGEIIEKTLRIDGSASEFG